MTSRDSYWPSSSIEPARSFAASHTTNEQGVTGQASLIETQVVTEPLGGSALSLAVQAGKAPTRWYVDPPRSVAGWRERIETIGRSFAGGEWAAALMPALQ